MEINPNGQQTVYGNISKQYFRGYQKTILFLQGFLMLNFLWFIGAITTDTTVMPNPIDVYKSFETLISNGIIMHIWESLKRIFIGIFLSLVIGVPTGMLMALSSRANKFLYPLIYFSYPIPKTALLPVAMLLWGMRDGSKIIIIFLIIVFQVIIAVRDGVRNIDSQHYIVARCAGASKVQIISHIVFPAILPEIFTSLRISVGTATAVLFFVEGYGTQYGMGYYILNAWSRINYIDMYGGIVVISLVGFGLFAIIDSIFTNLCGWKEGER